MTTGRINQVFTEALPLMQRLHWARFSLLPAKDTPAAVRPLEQIAS